MKLTPQNVSRAVTASFGKFDHLRKAREMFLHASLGRFYVKQSHKDKDPDRKASPLNLLNSAVSTLVPQLVFNRPKINGRSNILPYRDYAEMLGMATSDLAKRIKLRDTLRRTIFDAVYMAGYIKTGLARSDQYIVMDGVEVAVGQPYAERVDPDNMILCPWAEDWREQVIVGDRFKVDVDDLEALGLNMDELLKVAKDSAQTKRVKVSELSGKSGGEEKDSDIRTFIELCEVYLPKENIVVTMPYYADGKADTFLSVAEYSGPDTGPYHQLGFTPVSNNLVPVAPAGLWYDLHQMGNRMARKVALQAGRNKRVLAYEDEASEDVEAIAEANDGETVRVRDINKIKELEYGGVTEKSYEQMEWIKRNFSEQAGSIDLLGGQGSNVPTLGQAEMLQANTSVKLGDMQGIVYDFTADVSRDLAFYLHTDPLIELPMIRRKDGQEQQVVFTPEMRRGDFFDFTFEIEPFSMARPDPNTTVRRKMEFVTNAIPAAAQAAMMFGPGFRVGAFLKSLARDVQMEDLDEWLDDVAVQQWLVQKIQMAMLMGDPGKAGAGSMPMAPAPPAQFNPQQPVPSAMGPKGGISPDTEAAAAQQESSAESQSTRMSARDMALARGQ
jgi:hypothetical protein